MIEAGAVFMYAARSPPAISSTIAMQKPLALSLALCLSLTGCQVFEKSKTWDTVMSVKPLDSFRQADPSAHYAEKLHQVLLDQGVEHYVVTYQYHYYTGHYEEAVGTRTAVVYRDDVDSRYPWWLKDDRTATPFWLPAGDLNSQLSFYARRKAEVIERKHYPSHGGGKEVVAPRRTVQNKVQFRGGISQASQPKPHVAERSQPVTKIALVKPAAAQAPKRVLTFQPVVEKTAPASHTAALDSVQQAAVPAPHEAHLEKLFRSRNGTAYDPSSLTDRRKMEQLKHGLVGKETTGERGFLRGVDSDTPGTF